MRAGDRIATYELLAPIHETASSTVWAVRSSAADDGDPPVALKLFSRSAERDEAARRRYEREIKVFQEVRDEPGFVRALGWGIDPSRGPWLAMERLAGSVKDLGSPDPAKPAVVYRVLLQVAEALQTLHERRRPILHLDIKPSNVLIDRIDSAFHCCLTDFGVSRLGEDPALARDREISARYAAPELFDRARFGAEGGHTDLYALGMVGVELALGERRLRAQVRSVYGNAGDAGEVSNEPGKWAFWHTSESRRISPVHELILDFPRDVSEVLEALTRKDPRERLGRARHLLDRLRASRATDPDV